jgi:Plasmid encoded RepA protein
VAPVRSILEGFAREDELRVSRQQQRRAQTIELIREQRNERSQPLLFGARPFLLRGLPLRRPPADTLIHRRRNGQFFLDVCGHPDFGLPFGQDRLIPIWVATQAVRLRAREFQFRSGAEILEEFGLPLDGPHYRRLIDGFQRIFASTIYFGTGDQTDCPVWDCTRFAFFDRLKLWVANKTQASMAPSSPNTIILSEAFWNEIRAHEIPVEREVVRALANSPGTLDFCMWAAWRCYSCRGPLTIPLFGPSGLTTQLGTGDYGRPRDFRQTIRRWVDVVRHVWPACPVELADDGATLIIRPARVIHKPL